MLPPPLPYISPRSGAEPIINGTLLVASGFGHCLIPVELIGPHKVIAAGAASGLRPDALLSEVAIDIVVGRVSACGMVARHPCAVVLGAALDVCRARTVARLVLATVVAALAR